MRLAYRVVGTVGMLLWTGPRVALRAQDPTVRARATGLALKDSVLQMQRQEGEAFFRGGRGMLLADGDSWFDYPRRDVLKSLSRRFNYTVEDVAHYGARLEDIAYNADHLLDFADKLEELRQKATPPLAILLSAGGNDIASNALEFLLNSRRSGQAPLRPELLTPVINGRLREAYVTWLTAVTELSRAKFDRAIPIVVHGYADPVPDGRGFLGGFWMLPGPWLEPRFTARGYPRSGAGLTENTATMSALIDTFNNMLRTVAGQPEFAHVRYVSLRDLLRSDAAYEADWANELHPTRQAFDRIAARIDSVLARLPRPASD